MAWSCPAREYLPLRRDVPLISALLAARRPCIVQLPVADENIIFVNCAATLRLAEEKLLAYDSVVSHCRYARCSLPNLSSHALSSPHPHLFAILCATSRTLT